MINDMLKSVSSIVAYRISKVYNLKSILVVSANGLSCQKVTSETAIWYQFMYTSKSDTILWYILVSTDI